MSLLLQRVLGVILIVSSISLIIRLEREDITKKYKTFKKRHQSTLSKIFVPNEHYYGKIRGLPSALLLIAGTPLLHLSQKGYLLVGFLIVVTYITYTAIKIIRTLKG